MGLLGLIPIIGPIVDGIVTIIKGKQDTGVKHAEIEAGVTKTALVASNELTMAFMADVWVRVCRDALMTMGTIYCCTIIWDRWIEIKFPHLVWGVRSLQGPMEYLPYALLTFFFGSTALYFLRRK